MGEYTTYFGFALLLKRKSELVLEELATFKVEVWRGQGRTRREKKGEKEGEKEKRRRMMNRKGVKLKMAGLEYGGRYPGRSSKEAEPINTCNGRKEERKGSKRHHPTATGSNMGATSHTHDRRTRQQRPNT